jgi:predicted transposase YdaD
MPLKFDAANKHLLETYPAHWIAMAKLPPGSSIQVVDGDLSAVSASADKLIRVEAPQPYIAHFEPQAGPEPDLDQRTLFHTVLAWRRFKLPVLSVVLLLRPAALTTEVTGHISVNWSPEHQLKFSYKLIRVWELPVKSVLEGGIGTLPLAPISAVGRADLPDVIDAMKRRLDKELPPPESRDVWTATKILMGLRYPRDVVSVLLKGVANMEESTTYQEIIEKGMERGLARGRLAESRATLLRQGGKRLGIPSRENESRLDAISDLNYLETLVDRVFDGAVKTWDELLSE